jgi:hypothetical protein
MKRNILLYGEVRKHFGKLKFTASGTPSEILEKMCEKNSKFKRFLLGY